MSNCCYWCCWDSCWEWPKTASCVKTRPFCRPSDHSPDTRTGDRNVSVEDLSWLLCCHQACLVTGSTTVLIANTPRGDYFTQKYLFSAVAKCLWSWCCQFNKRLTHRPWFKKFLKIKNDTCIIEDEETLNYAPLSRTQDIDTWTLLLRKYFRIKLNFTIYNCTATGLPVVCTNPLTSAHCSQ